MDTPPPNMNGDAEGPCTNTQCAHSRGILEGVNATLRMEKAAALEDAAALRRQNVGLQDEIDRLRGRKKHTRRTWPGMVRQHLLTGDPTWEEVCRQCNKEENMSVNIKRVHPNIRFVQQDEADAAIDDLPGSNVNGPFNFNGLPAEVQAGIFKIWLFKEGKLLHAISRLDPFVPLEEFPEEAALSRRSGLKHTFFFGERNCSITHSGQTPNSLLRILLVSRRFYFIGIHCFYGLNTFAFSSLGEFHRFCQGIGPARFERLQHLEIALSGNQYLTVALDPKGRLPYSRRTFGLTFLPDCQRLRTLVIHIDESGKNYQRRRSEDSSYKQYMGNKTAGQPNKRKLRALRTIQGIDFIYTLRGLEWIRFYDLHKAMVSGTDTREPVADWSFVEDVTNTATMQKVPSRRESSKLENLVPLFSNGEQGDWNPSRADWELVKGFYIDNGGIWSYDQLRQEGLPHDADVPSLMSASSGPRQGGSSSSSPSSSSSSSSSSGGPHHGRTGPPIEGPGGQQTTKGHGGFLANIRLPDNPLTPSIAVSSETFMSSGSSSSESNSGDSQDNGLGDSYPNPNPDSDADMETNSPPDGRAGSEIIEVPSDSDSDSDEDSLFVSQNNRHNDHLEYNSNRSRHSTSPGTGDAGTPMVIDDEDDEDDHNPHHQHHNSSPSPSPHPSQAPSTIASVPTRMHSLTPMDSPSLMDRAISVPGNLFLNGFPSSAPATLGTSSSNFSPGPGSGSRSGSTPTDGGPPSFAALLNIQPASARYLPPNNPAAMESAAARRSRSISRTISRSVSARPVSRPESGSSMLRNRVGTASTSGYGQRRSQSRFSERSERPGSRSRLGLSRERSARARERLTRLPGGVSARERQSVSVDLTSLNGGDGNGDEHDDESGTSGGGGNGGMITIDEDGDEDDDEKENENENENEDGDGDDVDGSRDSGYEGADDSDVEMMDSV